MFKSFLLTFVGLAAASFGLLSACDEDSSKECTEIGCVDGLMIDFTTARGWQAGHYRFEITLDGQLTTCDATLPFAGCATQAVTCTSNDGRIVVGEGGCLLPPESHTLGPLTIGLPQVSQLGLRILHNDAEVFTQLFTPIYTTSQPNGPGCEPTCTSGNLQVDLTAVSR